MGGEVGSGTAVTLDARLEPAASGAALTLLRDGAIAAHSTSGAVSVSHAADAPAAVYRVEAHWPGAPGVPPVPWIVTNAIRVGFPAARAAVPLLPSSRWDRPVPVVPWVVEQHPASTVRLAPTILTPTNTAWTMTWTLGSGQAAGQYAAMAVPLPRGFLKGADRIAFNGRAARPMRVSIQVRSAATGRRWLRSAYLSPDVREVELALREFTPAVPSDPAPLDLEAVDALLVVVDTVNTVPGSTGETWISEVRVEGI
jgi:hypothetical protein